MGFRPYNPFSGGGGGARIPVLVSGSPFADLAALETWSQTNQTELHNDADEYAVAQVGTNPNFSFYQWVGPNQSYAVNSWANVSGLSPEQTSAVQSIISLTDNSIPVASSGTLVASRGRQDNAGWDVEGRVAADDLESSKDSVDIGDILRLSEDGGRVRLTDTTLGTRLLPAGSVINADESTTRAFRTARTAQQEQTLQPDKSETVVGNYEFESPVTFNRNIASITIEMAQDVTGVRITFRENNANGPVLWQSHTDAEWESGGGFSFTADTETKLTLLDSARVDTTIDLFVRTEKFGDDSTLELKGATVGGTFLPFLKQEYTLQTQVPLADAEDIAHPVTLRRDMPTSADAQELVDSSLNNNSALWVVANNQISTGGPYSGHSNRSDATLVAQIPGFLDLDGNEIPTTPVAANTIELRTGTIVRVFAANDYRVVNSPVFEGDITDNQRTDEDIRDVIGSTLVAGMNITINVDDANDTITISSTGGSGGGNPPAADADRIYYGLSQSADTTTIDVTTLTREDNPTNPDTISTGASAQGDYFVLYVPMTHDITSIFDTVLQQDVTSIFTALDNAQTVDTISFKSYIIGPLNAGVNEQYVINF